MSTSHGFLRAASWRRLRPPPPKRGLPPGAPPAGVRQPPPEGVTRVFGALRAGRFASRARAAEAASAPLSIPLSCGNSATPCQFLQKDYYIYRSVPHSTRRKASGGVILLSVADEPATKRAIIFFGGQNLFHGAKEAFGYTYPNYDPVDLAKAVCGQEAGSSHRSVSIPACIPLCFAKTDPTPLSRRRQ